MATFTVVKSTAHARSACAGHSSFEASLRAYGHLKMSEDHIFRPGRAL